MAMSASYENKSRFPRFPAWRNEEASTSGRRLRSSALLSVFQVGEGTVTNSLAPIPISAQGETMAGPTRKRAEADARLTVSLADWTNQISALLSAFNNVIGNKAVWPFESMKGYVPILQKLEYEMRLSADDHTSITQSLTAAKADAEYREVLVRAWPVNHFLDRMSYLGAAILGAGGAGFVLVGLDVALFFWAIGLALMGSALYGMRKWELKKWEFYADQFSIEEKYRPASRWGRRSA